MKSSLQQDVIRKIDMEFIRDLSFLKKIPEAIETHIYPMRKEHLPEKTCVVCNRPFAWRKKWEKNWDAVKYCSKRCSGDAKKLKNP